MSDIETRLREACEEAFVKCNAAMDGKTLHNNIFDSILPLVREMEQNNELLRKRCEGVENAKDLYFQETVKQSETIRRLEGEMKELRDSCNARYWEKIRGENTELRKQLDDAIHRGQNYHEEWHEAEMAVREAAKERDTALARAERAEAGEVLADSVYRGNSVQHWVDKATAYGNMVLGCEPALRKAGFPVDASTPDGAVGGVARAVANLAEAKELAEAANAEMREAWDRIDKVWEKWFSDDGSIYPQAILDALNKEDEVFMSSSPGNALLERVRRYEKALLKIKDSYDGKSIAREALAGGKDGGK